MCLSGYVFKWLCGQGLRCGGAALRWRWRGLSGGGGLCEVFRFFLTRITRIGVSVCCSVLFLFSPGLPWSIWIPGQESVSQSLASSFRTRPAEGGARSGIQFCRISLWKGDQPVAPTPETHSTDGRLNLKTLKPKSFSRFRVTFRFAPLPGMTRQEPDHLIT